MEQAKTNPTIASAIENYIKFIKQTRSENTGRACALLHVQFKRLRIICRSELLWMEIQASN